MTLLLDRAYCPGCGRMLRPGARTVNCRQCLWSGDVRTLREMLAGPGEYVANDVDFGAFARRVRDAVLEGR